MNDLCENLEHGPFESARLKQLVNAKCEGTLAPREQVELTTMLERSLEARRTYIALMQLHFNLDWTIRGRQCLESLVDAPSNSILKQPARSATVPRADVSDAHSWTRKAAWLVLAASLLIAIGASLWMSGVGPDVAANKRLARSVTRERKAITSSEIVARVVQLSKECNWFLENSRERVLQEACAGDVIRLTKGELRLDFTSGVTLTMKSPAVLSLSSSMKARAILGAFTAHVAKGAEGFTLETPRTKVIDLGTDFGVDVSEHGSTDVVVFSGRVDLHYSNDMGGRRHQRLRTGQGVRVSGEGTTSRIVSIEKSRFSTASNETSELVHRPPVITAVRDNISRGASWSYYEIVHEGMGEDAKAFADRVWHEWNGVTASGMPGYLFGGDYVKTFNDDKLKAHLRVSVEISQPSMLYVLLDDRLPVPDWLRGEFHHTGDKIGLDGGGYSRNRLVLESARGPGESVDDVFSVWRKIVDAPGEVELGPVGDGKFYNMYGIVAVPIQLSDGADDYAGSTSALDAAAAPVVLDGGHNAEVRGIVENVTDVDVFSLEWLGGPLALEIETLSRNMLNPTFTIYDSRDAVIAIASSSQSRSERASFRKSLPAGTYYIAVSGGGNEGEIGHYRLTIRPSSESAGPATIPPGPLRLTGTSTQDGNRLSWSGLGDMDSFTVERSLDGVVYETVVTTKEAQYLDFEVAPATTYFYRVWSDIDDERIPSRAVAVKTRAAMVGRLHATAWHGGQVLLDWADVRGEEKYRIERSVDGKNFDAIAEASRNSRGFADHTISPGMQYFYRVATIDAGGDAAVSETVTVFTCVSDLRAEALGAERVRLTWTGELPPEKLSLQRADADELCFETIAFLSGVETDYIDTVPSTGRYAYRIISATDAHQLEPVRTEDAKAIALTGRERPEHFAVRIVGRLNIDQPGIYQFHSVSDDGSRLKIDGRVVVDNDWLHSERELSGSAYLTSGEHEFEVSYFNRLGKRAFEIAWAGPGFAQTAIPRSAFTALEYKYYEGDWWRLPFDEIRQVSPVGHFVPSLQRVGKSTSDLPGLAD